MPPPETRGPERARDPSCVSARGGVTTRTGVAPQRRDVAAFWGEEATLPAVTLPGRPCHTGSAEGTPRDLSERERGGDIPGMLLSQRERGGDMPGMFLSRRDLCTSPNSLEFLGNCILAQRYQTGDCGNKTHKPWETVASSKDGKKEAEN